MTSIDSAPLVRFAPSPPGYQPLGAGAGALLIAGAVRAANILARSFA